MRRLKTCGAIALVLLGGCATKQESPSPAPATTPVVEKPAPKPPRDLDTGFVEPKQPAPQGTLLRMKYTPGASVKRELTGMMSSAPVPGQPAPPEASLQATELSMTYTTTVQAVKGDVATLKIDSSPLHVTKKGTNGDWVQSKGGELQVDTRGRIYTDVYGLVSGIQGIGLIAFPKGRVSVGSKWSQDSVRDMSPFGMVRMTENYTYLGMANGMHKVGFTATGSLPGFKATGTFLYRSSDMALMSADLTQGTVVDVPAEKPTKVRMAMTVAVRAK